MDLRIRITDENSDILQDVQVYQDGSDSEGAQYIADLIAEHYTIDEEANMVYNFDALDSCPVCGKKGAEMWMNDVPLRSFCWGPQANPHEEHSQVVPMKKWDE